MNSFEVVTINAQEVEGLINTVNGRDLHQELESKKDFSSWIKNKIDRAMLVKDEDYVVVNGFNEKNRRGGHNKIEYLVTRQAAMMIAAIENNAKSMAFIRRLIDTSILSIDDMLELVSDIDLPDADEMYIYAIKEAETGRLKIGISKNPAQRLKQLQTGNSQTLTVEAIIPAPNKYKDESALHKSLSKYHVRGEFYDMPAETIHQPKP